MLRPGETLRDPETAGAAMEPIFTPPSRTGTRLQPGMLGGSEWSPVALHPDLGLAFISGLVQPANYFVIPEVRPRPGNFRFGGIPVPDLVGVSGTLTAIDVNAGAIRWQNQTGRPLVGGALATAGGLLFYGEGTPAAGAFVALDASTGSELFRYKTRGGVNAAPMTFLADGEQWVTVAAGGHLHFFSRLDNQLITFGLK
jgi:glucose dehydrogenase